MNVEIMDDSEDDAFDRLSDLTVSDIDADGADAPDTEGTDAPENTPATSPPSSSYKQDEPYCREKRLECPYENCNKRFNRPVRLDDHIRSHTNERLFKCTYQGCSKTYLRDSHLKHHVKSAHTKVRDYKCSWKGCDKSFTTGTRLRNHLAVHEGHERYRCRGFGDCSQTFRKKDTLRRHIVSVHQGAKPFPCPEQGCSKAFDTAERLRRHQRVNHDPERYSCEICLESIEADVALSEFGRQRKRGDAHFATYTEFQNHNSEFHPPTCEHCNMAFNTKKQLMAHLEIQHDILDPSVPAAKKISCTHEGCGKQYTTQGNLSEHIKRVHKGEFFWCRPDQVNVGLTEQGLLLKFLEKDAELPVQEGTDGYIKSCGKHFTSKIALQEHVRTQHLGLSTQREEKNKKRKAEKAALESDSADTGKARLYHGIPKTNFDADIVGTSDAHQMLVYTGAGQNFLYNHQIPFNVGTSQNFPYRLPMPVSAGTSQTFPVAAPMPPNPFPVRYSHDWLDLSDDPLALSGDETLFNSVVYGLESETAGADAGAADSALARLCSLFDE